MKPGDSRVLLVDDDPAMLRILSKWLENAGYLVRSAADGRDALAAIETDCPEFLVTDWEMPNMNGLELCRRVRQLRLPHYVYILFLTVKSAPKEMVQGLEVGADDFLSKPVYQGELLARMHAGFRVLQLERRLSRMACTDPLTGLMTRRAFYELLETEWQRAEQQRLPLSCAIADLDFFKRINDLHGHAVGDSILKSVAELLTDVCRSNDSICRYGGEEFCVLLSETGESEAAVWAEAARQRLAALVVPLGDREIRLTGSFGVAQRYDDTQHAEELVDQADQALLCAKQSGRDRVVCYQSLGDASEFDLDGSGPAGGLFHGIAARHVMSPMVACLREDETVGQAAEFFLRSRINSTPVVDAEGKLTGILSEKDLMAAVVSLDWWEEPVRDLMKPNVICYDEETPIQTIYEFLCRVSIRRVVIVSDGRPTGTISRGTLLRWFKNLVLSKGLLEDQPALADGSQADPHRSKQRLAETARQLAHQASKLQHHVQQDAEDLVPYVVGSATGMQELVNDLLAYSRYANRGAEADLELPALLVDGDPLSPQEEAG
jgi:diguanylate cyclase (GGDEF)-like protein